ncbi:MAG: hypothetical protein KI786_01435 [Mameliella sp.]|nr:hypothetical protein [Phaeodactylibacter sp.]
MNYQRKSVRSARTIRTKAVLLTLLFHVGVAAYLTLGSDLDVAALLPESVLELFGVEVPETTDIPIP